MLLLQGKKISQTKKSNSVKVKKHYSQKHKRTLFTRLQLVHTHTHTVVNSPLTMMFGSGLTLQLV